MEPSRRPMYFEPFAGGAALLFSLYGAAPFLRWAGGKRQLLSDLHARLPRKNDQVFYNPGEGSPGEGSLLREVPCLNDANWRLMTTYMAVAVQVEAVITILTSPTQRSGKAPLEDTQDCYYYVRDVLNAIQPDMLEQNPHSGGYAPEDLRPRVAAAMIYLNRTGFNGLYRENAKGLMNTPYGHNTKHGIKKIICDRETLRRASTVLQYTELACEDFREVTARGQKGDFFYFDPPYWPVKATSFTGYVRGGTAVASVNVDLAAECKRLSGVGARFLASNADVPQVHELYKGFTIERVSARRNVNSKASGRGPVGELLIRNY